MQFLCAEFPRARSCFRLSSWSTQFRGYHCTSTKKLYRHNKPRNCGILFATPINTTHSAVVYPSTHAYENHYKVPCNHVSVLRTSILTRFSQWEKAPKQMGNLHKKLSRLLHHYHLRSLALVGSAAMLSIVKLDSFLLEIAAEEKHP